MIGQNLIAHAEAYGVGAVAFLIAVGKSMPKPGSSFSWLTFYTWLYDSVQAVLPVPRNPPPPPPIVLPPPPPPPIITQPITLS
jgi:hypothetical protein